MNSVVTFFHCHMGITFSTLSFAFMHVCEKILVFWRAHCFGTRYYNKSAKLTTSQFVKFLPSSIFHNQLWGGNVEKWKLVASTPKQINIFFSGIFSVWVNMTRKLCASVTWPSMLPCSRKIGIKHGTTGHLIGNTLLIDKSCGLCLECQRGKF